MKMREIEVSIIQGEIYLVQPGRGGDEDVIAFHPDQAELLCKWIMSAAEGREQEQ